MGLYVGLLILTICLIGGMVFGRLLLAFLRAARDGGTRPEDVAPQGPQPGARPDPRAAEAAQPRLAVVAALAAPRQRPEPAKQDPAAAEALDGEVLPPRHADPIAATTPWHNGRGILVQESV
ncbi:MAG: hypothetical protein JNK11_12125 [Alphaproteobacteria bacterium]|nr:hypothetical protein [Alphaproteobacteria bacterium]